MAGIFINYRRDDAPGVAGRLFDYLTTKFPRRELFMDVDAMKPGMDFVKQLDTQVSQCHVLLAVIGPHWLEAQDHEGHRRLDSAHDYVRIELASALTRDIPVIPVLVDGAMMPPEESLPDDLKSLVRRHALELRHTRFSADANALVRALQDMVPRRQPPWRMIGIGAGGLAGLALIAVLAPRIIGMFQPGPAPEPVPPPPAFHNPPAIHNPPAVVNNPSPGYGRPIGAETVAGGTGLDVTFGDTIDKVRSAYDIRGTPTNGCGSSTPCLTLEAPRDGLMFFFKKTTKLLYEIRADAPFDSSIEGVHIGDSLDDLLSRFGQPSRTPWDFGDNKAYLFTVNGLSLRCDINSDNKVATIFYFND